MRNIKIEEEDIDYSDIPEIDDDFWNNAIFHAGIKSELLTIRLDPEVLSWFKQHGQGYKAQINAILKNYVENALKNVGTRTNTEA